MQGHGACLNCCYTFTTSTKILNPLKSNSWQFSNNHGKSLREEVQSSYDITENQLNYKNFNSYVGWLDTGVLWLCDSCIPRIFMNSDLLHIAPDAEESVMRPLLCPEIIPESTTTSLQYHHDFFNLGIRDQKFHHTKMLVPTSQLPRMFKNQIEII